MAYFLRAGAGAAVVSGAVFALTIKLARVAVMPKPFRNVRVHAVDAGRVTLEANPRTTHAGTFGLSYDAGAGHAIIGEILSTDRRAKTVERVVLATAGSPLQPTRYSHWEGDVFNGPREIDAAAQDVDIPVAGGTAPAWLIPPVDGTPDDNDTWAIHVHGIRTTRINALRTVPAARSLGFTSLVVSYRGDGEGPATYKSASMLGMAEWPDVDAAITYAVKHGARRIVLFGWSMGASVVLLTSERSENRDLIAGVVVVSPALQWRGTIRHGAHIVGLPRVCGDLAMAALSSPRVSRIVGVPEPIDFDAMDWSVPGRIQKPCLVVHSAGDEKIPISISKVVVAANPDRAELFETPHAGHAWEYNVSPELFDNGIATWLRDLPFTK
ncbi:alpha/beta hydrolase family protein [Clavibacter michiganensis]|uniref:alpha/beta hydrolase family protein n=2 Tax=Clavibacter michiganensis TaxID=28447 RepID=UPI002930C064|nr:alpha/beta fold hydrolase [Clavibacter michiganensis]